MQLASKPVNDQSRPPQNRVDLILQGIVLWHAVVTVAAFLGVAAIWLFESQWDGWQRLVVTAVLLVLGISSGLTIPLLRQRDHRGRVFSLVINYLGFLVMFLGGMQVLGVFIGLDAVANTFGRALPFLGVILAGYLLRDFSTRIHNNPQQRQNLVRAGNLIMLLGLAIFLLVIGIIPGILALLSRINSLDRLVIVLAALLFGIAAGLMWRGDVAVAMGEKSQDSEMLNGFLFVSPNVLGFLLFFAGPLIFSLYVSFTDSDAFGTQNWIGLQNYQEILNLDVAQLNSATQVVSEALDITEYAELMRFSIFGKHYIVGAQDKLFWISLRNTLLFVITAVPLSVLPALVLSTILNSKIPGMKLFRMIYFIPSIAAVVGVALIWRWLYNSTVGWINYFITEVVTRFNGIVGIDMLTDPQIGWLSDTNVALFAVVIIAAWQWMGFNTVLYLAGLQNIPKSIYEAATVDGAGPVRQFLQITVPLLAPTTFFVVSTTTIQAMQIFDQVFVLTNPPGGPGTSTQTIVLYLYTQGFRNFRQGYASAIAWTLFLLIFGLTIFQFQRQRNESGD